MLTEASCCCAQQHLSNQEVSVIVLVARGMSNQQIGRVMSISRHTVASYLASAMRRLTVQNRAELVARCYAAELLRCGTWPPVSTGRRCLAQTPR